MPKKRVAKKVQQNNAGTSKPQQKLKGRECCGRKAKDLGSFEEEEKAVVVKAEAVADSSPKGKGCSPRKAKDLGSFEEEEKAVVVKAEARADSSPKGKGCSPRKAKDLGNFEEEEKAVVVKAEARADSSPKGKGCSPRKAKNLGSSRKEEKSALIKTKATAVSSPKRGRCCHEKASDLNSHQKDEKVTTGSSTGNNFVDAFEETKVVGVKGKRVAKKPIAQKPTKSAKIGKQEADLSGTAEELVVKRSPKKRGSSSEKGDLNLQDEAVEGSTKTEEDDKKVRHRKRKAATEDENLSSPKKGILQVKRGTMIRSPAKVTKTIKAISWNVAGIRAWVKKNAHKILVNESPDLLGLQEIKCNSVPEEIDLKGYNHYLESSAEKSGYAGVLLLAKQKPIKLRNEAGGRMIVAEFEGFYFISSYVPNSGRGLVNLAKRKKWEDWFIKEIKKWDAIKPVIYSGDLNVAHEEIDLANPKTNRNKTAGFTDQERNDFTRLLEAGFVDVYRKLNPEKEGAYTYWSNMFGARSRNIGWRLDYFVVSERIFDRVTRCEILSDISGSDHCPILLEITF